MTTKYRYFVLQFLILWGVLIKLTAINFLQFHDFTSSFSVQSDKRLQMNNPVHNAPVKLELNIKTIENGTFLYSNAYQKIQSRSVLLPPRKQQGPGETTTFN